MGRDITPCPDNKVKLCNIQLFCALGYINDETSPPISDLPYLDGGFISVFSSSSKL